MELLEMVFTVPIVFRWATPLSERDRELKESRVDVAVLVVDQIMARTPMNSSGDVRSAFLFCTVMFMFFNRTHFC